MRISTVLLIAMRTVQSLGGGLRQSLPVLFCLSVVMLLTMHPALAMGFGSDGGFSAFAPFIFGLRNFLFASAGLAGAICIIGGVWTFIRSGEINQGMLILAGVAVGLGALVAIGQVASGAAI